MGSHGMFYFAVAACLLSILGVGVQGHMFDKNVAELTPNNIDKFLKTGKPVMIMFYAPWCGHCQRAVGAWNSAASKLKGMVKVGAVNADEHKSLGGQYGVRGFPTIKFWTADKKKGPQDYQGARTTKGFADHGISLIADKVTAVKDSKAFDKLVEKANKDVNLAVLLFTNKPATPPLFKALSSGPQFKDKLVFGLVRDNAKDLVGKFSVSEFPKIGIVDTKTSEVKEWYTGDIQYDAIAKWLSTFVKGGEEEEAPEEPKKKPNAKTESKKSEKKSEKSEKPEKKAEKKEEKKENRKVDAMSLKPFAADVFTKHCTAKRICVLGFVDGQDDTVAQALKGVADASKGDNKLAFFSSTDADQLNGFGAAFQPDVPFAFPTVLAYKAKSSGAKYVRWSGASEEGANAQGLQKWLDRVTMGEEKFQHVDQTPYAAAETQ